MATTTVGNILDKAELILQDTTNTRWSVAELIGWLNDAYKEIVLARPDANTLTASVPLNSSTGTRQKLSDASGPNLSEALRVIDIVRNTAAGSNKRAIRQIDRRILDDQIPDWHDVANASVNIQHWMFDLRVPKEFMVYPPAAAGATIEIAYSSVPTAHSAAATSDTIKLDDVYANVILDYVLYRAYSKDVDYAANGQRAAAHYQSFATAIGTKTTVDTTVTKAPEPVSAT